MCPDFPLNNPIHSARIHAQISGNVVRVHKTLTKRCVKRSDTQDLLFGELGLRYATRNGGYLRILKCGFRVGDNAPMALVELLDRPSEDVPASGA